MLKVAVELGTEEVGDEHVYIEMPLSTREDYRIESTVYYLHPYISTDICPITFDKDKGYGSVCTHVPRTKDTDRYALARQGQRMRIDMCLHANKDDGPTDA